MSKQNSVFKYVFITLAGLVVFLIGFSIFMLLNKGLGPDDRNVAVILIFPLMFALAFLAMIATLVYRDAKKKGMDPWLWATVATFMPNLIGVIIYLIVRYNVKKTCVACGKGLQGDFMVCPYCGASQEVNCPACQKPTAPDWKICPHCGHKLKELEN